ncbi:MAG: hypothetical protein AB7F22_29105 [Reyranella sp.]|uniref:hypothetical protein n=1 Tax=Reyranella sp. TaxID=1929291 RepID=UPI003D0D277C
MTTLNRTTLVKVLEILDSSHADEALAAAKLASTMVREAGLTWDEVLAATIGEAPSQPPPDQLESRAAGAAGGAGPFGYRRDREPTAHEQFFMLLLSPRTPPEIKNRLRGWEARVLDGEITPQDTADLQSLYRSFVAG